MKNVKGVTSSMGSAVHAAKRASDLISVLIDNESTDVVTIARLEKILKNYGEEHPKIVSEELPELRSIAKKIQQVLGTKALTDTVQQINTLLDAYGQAPRLTAHGHNPWHLHIDSSDHASWAEWFATSSAFALAVLVAEKQRIPGGLCAATGCENPFIDLGKGGGRNFCSPRCATRERVAAHRSRLIH